MIVEARRYFLSIEHSNYAFDIPLSEEELINEILENEGLRTSLEELAKKTKYLDDVDTSVLKRAVITSYYFHDKKPKHEKNRFRKDGSHFVNHTLATTSILAEEKQGIDSLVGGLFHDTIEDTHTSLEWISQHFGPTAARLVDGMTNISSKHSKEQNEAQSLKKKYDALRFDEGGDPRIIIGKLADRLHNMRTLNHPGISSESQVRIAFETLEVYVPLARRTGMLKWKEELELHSYSILFPHRQKEIKHFYNTRQERVDAERKNIVSFYRKMCGRNTQVVVHNPSIEGSVREVVNPGDRHNPPVHTISIVYPEAADYATICKTLEVQQKLFGGSFESRLKNSFGVFRIGDTEIEVRPQENFKRHQTSIAHLFRYQLDPESEKAQEIQGRLRTKLQPEIELIKRYENQKDRRIRDLELVHYLKEDLFSKFLITVYTPKGEDKRIALGATALDFATSVHEKMLFSTEVAQINDEQEFSPPDSVLNAGDKVKLILRPGKKWEISPKLLQQIKTAQSFAVMREWVKNMEQIDKIGEVTSLDDIHIVLAQHDLLHQYEELFQHGYSLAKIHQEVRNFKTKAPEIGKNYLQNQFKYWLSHEPVFNLLDVWKYMEKRWAKLYPTLNSFLWDCAFQNVKSQHVYEFIEAAQAYEKTLISFPNILVPDKHGRLNHADRIISENGFGIVNLGITQNYRGNLAGIQYTLEPSRLVGPSTLRHVMNLEGYEVEEK